MKFKVFCFAVMFTFACVNCVLGNLGVEMICLLACVMLWMTIIRK